MRNLKLINLDRYVIPEGFPLVCINSDSEVLYAVNQNAVYKLETNALVTVFPLDISSHPKDVTYLYDRGLLCIITSGGEILLVDVNLKESECVGYVADGIQAVSWSPDQELLVIITGSDNLILMSKDFDPIQEKTVHSSDFGEKKPITAGWGSKETQFHGSIGKAAAKVQKPALQIVFAWDDKSPKISWRGDGQLFTTSTVDPDKQYRQLRIWERCGTLNCTSEDVDGLEDGLSWRPSGNLITSTKRSVNKHEVIFFEKNGLRHGEFTLPFTPLEFQVKGLVWNSASNILCIWGSQLESKDKCSTGLAMLWTSSNYHWYLKQTLQFKEAINTVDWDTIKPYVLRISTCNGNLLEYTWCWNTNHGIGSTSDCVAVIHGEEVFVTPFRMAVIPPPLYGYSLLQLERANDVIFGLQTNIVILCDNTLNIYKSDNSIPGNGSEKTRVKFGVIGTGPGANSKTTFPVHQTTISITSESPLIFPLMLYHWLWISESKLLCIMTDTKGCHLSEVLIDNDKQTAEHKVCLSLTQHILAMHCISTTTVVIEMLDGSIFRYNPESNSIEPWLIKGSILKLPQPCSLLSSCQIENQHHIIGLSERNKLVLNDKTICSNCTSFSVHNNFLLLTTHSHTLRCLTLDYDLKKVLDGQTLDALEDAPRALERGSRLVTVIPDNTKVILQMPRGNLETIQPRALVLDVVCNLLDRLEFAKAFDIMKVNRINLNLMFDHNPKAFLENCERFVSELATTSNINLFLLELGEGDVCQTMYSAAYRGKDPPEKRINLNGIPKVDKICNAVRTVLEKDEKRYLFSILTTYAKKVSPELDMALLKIKEMKDKEAMKTSSTEAIKYLMYLVDINKLYEVALGTYDFDLVLMVAEISNKDPKEYLPFLNELKSLEPNYQKYKIDLHLRRFKKALLHCSHCGEEHFEECLDLIKKQKLFKDALHLFTFDSDQNKMIWQAYGSYLMQKKHYTEAGVVFYRAKIYPEALEAFAKTGNWQLSLCVAMELGYNDAQKFQLAKYLAESLRSNGNHNDAAYLYEVHAQDPEESIATLIEGQLWNSALSQISRYNRSDLILTHFKPALQEQSTYVTTLATESKEAFLRYSQRLKLVREAKQKAMELDDEDEGEDGPDNDMYSDVSSVAALSERSTTSKSGSIRTRKSSRSSKQKLDRKKYMLKEGSANEDLALIAALSEIVTTAENLRDPVSSLLQALVAFNYYQEARDTQKALDQLYKLIEVELSKIWPPESNDDKTSLELGPSVTANSIAYAMRQQKKQLPLISEPSLRHPPKFKIDSNWKLLLLEQ